MKIIAILGTRPQIIKAASVLEAFKRANMKCAIVNTGQHYDARAARRFYWRIITQAEPKPTQLE